MNEPTEASIILTSLHLAVRDVEASTAFYRDGLGLAVDREDGSAIAVANLTDGTRILLDQGLGERLKVQSSHVEGAPHAHFHLQVHDVEAVKEKLRQQGHPIGSASGDGEGMQIFVTADPDGHNLEIFSNA